MLKQHFPFFFLWLLLCQIAMYVPRSCLRYHGYTYIIHQRSYIVDIFDLNSHPLKVCCAMLLFYTGLTASSFVFVASFSDFAYGLLNHSFICESFLRLPLSRCAMLFIVLNRPLFFSFFWFMLFDHLLWMITYARLTKISLTCSFRAIL